jgi:arylformamidase
MSKWVFLSHFIDENTPAYGGGEGFKDEAVKSIAGGDSCNTARWIIPNHLNTHIDFPKHFVNKGKALSDYEPDFWVFDSTSLMDISPVSPGERISYGNLMVDKIPSGTELLLIKTGFQGLRNKSSYTKNSPVFDPGIAEVLRECCPSIRVVGFDAISLSSFSNRELGRTAHTAFLSDERPILVLEDMDLDMVDSVTVFLSVVVSPLLVKNAGGSPCTILAKVSQ